MPWISGRSQHVVFRSQCVTAQQPKIPVELTLSAFARMLLRFFLPPPPPLDCCSGSGVGSRILRGWAAAFAIFDTIFCFCVGRFIILAERPMLGDEILGSRIRGAR